MLRKTPLRSRTRLKTKTPMKRIGPKARQYRRATRIGDKAIQYLKRCELMLEGCMGSFALSRAHRKKRRYCDDQELAIYCLACPSCHDTVEALSHEEMYRLVNEAIERRIS